MISAGKLGPVVWGAVAKACASIGTTQPEECAQKTARHIEKEVRKACARSRKADRVSLGKCQSLLGNTLWASHKELRESLGGKMPYLVRLLTTAYPISDSRGFGHEGLTRTIAQEAELFAEKFPGEKPKKQEPKIPALRTVPLAQLFDEKSKGPFAFTRTEEWVEAQSTFHFAKEGDLYAISFNWFYWLEATEDGEYTLYPVSLQEAPSTPPEKESPHITFRLKNNQYPPLSFSLLGIWEKGEPVFQGIRID